MSNHKGFEIQFSPNGEMILVYPDGFRDRTRIYPSMEDRLLMRTFSKSTSGQSLIMQLKECSIQCSATELFFREPARTMIQSQIERLSKKGFSGTVSVLVMDLDKFKRVNNDFGIAAGDKVIRWFADLLRDQTRGTDILVRWGGEEFVVFAASNDDQTNTKRRHRDSGNAVTQPIQQLKTGVTMADIKTVMTNGKDIADRIRKATAAAPCMTAGVEIPITVTIGVASAYINHQSSTHSLFDILMKLADEQLQAAKNANTRNSVHVANLIKPGQPTDSQLPSQTEVFYLKQKTPSILSKVLVLLIHIAAGLDVPKAFIDSFSVTEQIIMSSTVYNFSLIKNNDSVHLHDSR
jgi:diguanylate cyclase (GGDEF)-like protein